MTQLIRLDENGALVGYQFGDLFNDHPNVSFPEGDIPADTLAEFGIYIVEPTPAPTPGDLERVEAGPHELVDGRWRQTWNLIAITPEERRANIRPITRRQARHVLNAAGLLATVEDNLNALPEPQRTAALIDWQDASVFERDHDLITTMTAQLGLTDEQVDEMFLTGRQI